MKIIAKLILALEVVFFIRAIYIKLDLFPEKRIIDFSGEKILTLDDNGLEYPIKTQVADVNGALLENKISLSDKDELIPAKSTVIYPGMTISIVRPADITISVDGQTIKKTTFAKTVSDTLTENNVILSHLDKIDPGLQTRLSDNLKIIITRIKNEEIVNEESIDFSEIKQKDSQVDWGEKQISQKGEAGTKETTYRIDYEDGQEVKRTKLSSKITKTPVTQIVKIGTRLRIGKVNSGIASWYNAGENECASRDFPPGTWLRVTNNGNGKQIYVQVAGYGPQAGTGKLIDLDNAAFKKIAPLGQGTTKVKVEEILNKGFSPE